jgi:hypothetical protein
MTRACLALAASDVIALTVCPEGGRCERVADGASVVSVRVCVPDAVSVRAEKLEATLRTTAGTWLTASPGTETTVALSANRCGDVLLQTPRSAGPTQITGELSGFTVEETVSLQGAPVTAIEVLPTPLQLDGTGTLSVVATLRSGALGRPSEGTQVSFAVVSTDPSRAASVFPLATLATPEGQAQATVVTGKDVSSLTIRVTATPPATSESPEPASTSVELVVRSPPTP